MEMLGRQFLCILLLLQSLTSECNSCLLESITRSREDSSMLKLKCFSYTRGTTAHWIFNLLQHANTSRIAAVMKHGTLEISHFVDQNKFFFTAENFSLTIYNPEPGDEGTYQCLHGSNCTVYSITFLGPGKTHYFEIWYVQLGIGLAAFHLALLCIGLGILYTRRKRHGRRQGEHHCKGHHPDPINMLNLAVHKRDANNLVLADLTTYQTHWSSEEWKDYNEDASDLLSETSGTCQAECKEDQQDPKQRLKGHSHRVKADIHFLEEWESDYFVPIDPKGTCKICNAMESKSRGKKSGGKKDDGSKATV